MAENNTVVNINPSIATMPSMAPLQNVMLCASLLKQAMERQEHLPGIVGFFGPSGLGKSVAAAYSANLYRAYFVECKSTWTKKAFLIAILKEMSIEPAKSSYEMVEQIAEELAFSGRPLIIDEADHMVEKKAVEVIRDIYDASFATIMLIGEEKLEQKLSKWERVHNRVLAWQPAQYAGLNDVRHLAKLYCKEITIADDLLAHIQEQTFGIVRRICVNLNHVQQQCLNDGNSEPDLAYWGNREIYTGRAPKRKVR